MPNDPQSDDPQEWGEAVDTSTGQVPGPGDIVVGDEGLVASPEPLVGSGASTPLEEDEPEGTIPPCPLWAMKERRHIQWHLLPSHERHQRIRDAIGTGDDVIFVIDDGRHHAMVGRRVGAVEGECEYCLLGRVPLETYEALKANPTSANNAFADAKELALCGVAIVGGSRSSNIFDVSRFNSIDDVPPQYRPGTAFLNLTEDLEITA